MTDFKNWVAYWHKMHKLIEFLKFCQSKDNIKNIYFLKYTSKNTHIFHGTD